MPEQCSAFSCTVHLQGCFPGGIRLGECLSSSHTGHAHIQQMVSSEVQSLGAWDFWGDTGCWLAASIPGLHFTRTFTPWLVLNKTPLVFAWRSVISEQPQHHSTKSDTNPRPLFCGMIPAKRYGTCFFRWQEWERFPVKILKFDL